MLHELGISWRRAGGGLASRNSAFGWQTDLEKEIGGVEYSLGSIPAGGFVALPQLAPMK